MATPPPPPVWQDGQPAVPADIGPPAGFWIRVVASIIDWLVLCAIIGAMFGVVFGLAILLGGSSETAAGLGAFVAFIGVIVAAWLYEALLTSSPRGATLGKQAIGARVVRADGARLSFGRATARHFLKVLITPLVPFGIGFLLAAFTKGKRALHDFMADTLVTKVR